MIMRIAKAAGLELVDVDVQLAGLARSAMEIDLVGGNTISRISPLELLRRQNGHSRWIELYGVASRGEAPGECDGKRKVRQRMLCGHWLLPVSAFCSRAAC